MDVPRPVKILGLLLLASASLLGADGPLASWRFDRVEGGTVPDGSGNGNELSVAGARIETEGPARFLRLDGSDNATVVKGSESWSFPGGFTLAVRFRAASFRRADLLLGRPNKVPNWTTPQPGITLSEGKPIGGAMFRGGKVLLEGREIAAGAWAHIVFTCDGKTARLFQDGKEVASADVKGGIDAPATPVTLGGTGAVKAPLAADVAEAQVWERALETSEIEELFQSLAKEFRPGSATPTARAVDRFVKIASPGSRPGDNWRERPTRLLSGLTGYVPVEKPATDRWGGRLDKGAGRATGFFRVEKVGERWSLFTPEGHPFYHVAVNAVRPRTLKGKKTPGDWSAEVTAQLRSWNFNGAGNWSQEQLVDVADPLASCASLNVISTFAKELGITYPTSGHTGFSNECIPVFHPDFPAWADKACAALTNVAEKPQVLGVFTDNELQCPADLLDRNLALDASDERLKWGRLEALRWLAERGVEPERITRKDRMEWSAHVFATYSRIVYAACKKRAPNTLVLGSRFAEHEGQFANAPFWKAIGPWMDVVSVNWYGIWGPDRAMIGRWAEAARKPVMLTEWYAKALDATNLANGSGAGWLVRTQADRAAYYQHFALNALECPDLVGWHYFKYADDASDSKALDSVGGANKGLVTDKGEVWKELTEAATEVNGQVYPLLDFLDRRAGRGR